MPRTFSCALVLLLASTTARAQDEPTPTPPTEVQTEAAPSDATSDDATSDDATSDDATSDDATSDAPAADLESADAGSADAGSGESAGEETATGTPPKVAIIVSGDPDPALRAAARRVERALEGQLEAPYDPSLRAALRGEPGENDDGLEAVRRERRRLGLEESRDTPVLATLGRRAGASAVAVVRVGDGGPELTVLDVRNAAFYEGTLPLLGQPSSERIAEFVARRARISARGARIAAPVPAVPEVPAAATAPDAPEQPNEQPDFFEQFWPYLVAGVLLAGMITAIVITSTTAGSDQPVLRFVPGGR